MELTARDIERLTAFRHELHRFPEISGEEEQTAKRVVGYLCEIGVGEIITGLGGHGVAAVFDSGKVGPTVMIRAELDGLLIEETGNPSYKSEVAGKSHMCGHDGHMASLMGCAISLAKSPPGIGRVVLMFQPAEEDGSGSKAVIADPRFSKIAPDYAFSWHNLPGLPLGEAQLKSGPLCCASVGIQVRYQGRTAHASQPENGISPAEPLAELISEIAKLGKGLDTDKATATPAKRDGDYRLVTITYACLGEPTFGVAAGRCELSATLRTVLPEVMADLKSRASKLAEVIAQRGELSCEITWHDDFAASINDEEATKLLRDSCQNLGVEVHTLEEPMPFSEDFGRFGHDAKAAMVLLGSGDISDLHSPDYDFPDELIPIGASIMMEAARALIGSAAG